jgi:hypothetical protein
VCERMEVCVGGEGGEGGGGGCEAWIEMRLAGAGMFARFLSNDTRCQLTTPRGSRCATIVIRIMFVYEYTLN